MLSTPTPTPEPDLEPDTDPDRTIDYGYAETGWKDLMTVYDGDSITYGTHGLRLEKTTEEVFAP